MRSQMINLAAETKVLLLQLTETLWCAYIKLNGTTVMAMLLDTALCQDFKQI